WSPTVLSPDRKCPHKSHAPSVRGRNQTDCDRAGPPSGGCPGKHEPDRLGLTPELAPVGIYQTPDRSSTRYPQQPPGPGNVVDGVRTCCDLLAKFVNGRILDATNSKRLPVLAPQFFDLTPIEESDRQGGANDPGSKGRGRQGTSTPHERAHTWSVG